MKDTEFTIRQIAEAAGVSTTTVDRVLNGRTNVHPRTVAHVHDTILRLGEARPRAASDLLASFIVPGGTNQFHERLQATLAANDIFSSGKWSTNVETVDMFRPAQLAEALERAARSADAIGFVPFDTPRVREIVKDIAARGIPLVTMLSSLPALGGLPYVGQDNRVAGRTAGFLMGTMMAGRGRVAVMAGNLRFLAHEEREMGFRAVMREDFPEITLTETRESNDDLDQARRVAKELLAIEGVSGLYNIGGCTEAVIDVLRGRDGGGRLVAIEHELTPATRAALADGVLTAVVHQDASVTANNAVAMLNDAVKNTKNAASSRLTPIEVFTRENLPLS